MQLSRAGCCCGRCAAVLEGRQVGHCISVVAPGKPAELRAFWSFSGLDRWLQDGAEADTEHPQNVTVPLLQFAQAHFLASDPIIFLVRRHVGLLREDEDYLRYCVNEVIQNVEDHSRSPIGAVLCARFLQGPRQVRVAVTDRGVGIASTLRKRYPDVTNAAIALQRVIAGNYSARSRENNAGLGISFLWNAVKSLGGTIFILSDDAIAQMQADGQPNIIIRPQQWPGTGVFFSIPVRMSVKENDYDYE